MKDYYDSGAIPNMDSGEFHGQATLILIGFKDRSNLELMKAPGLSEILPSLYKLADEARAKKVVVRNYENELTYLYDESVGVKDIYEGVRMQTSLVSLRKTAIYAIGIQSGRMERC